MRHLMRLKNQRHQRARVHRATLQFSLILLAGWQRRLRATAHQELRHRPTNPEGRCAEPEPLAYQPLARVLVVCLEQSVLREK